MNPTTTTTTVTAAEPLPLIPPPQPPQPHRSSFSCDRHPQEQFTGFCPLCLCERLHTLDPNTSSSTTTKPSSSAAAALKSLLFKLPKPPSSSNFPELRRSKSFSASKPDHPFSGPFEPQRHSCDVRARNTLHSLFSLDNNNNTEPPAQPVHGEISESDEIPSFCGTTATTNLEEIIMMKEDTEKSITMKEHIDLEDSGQNNKKHSSSSFWSAASVFSKKMHKWMRKQTKLKKPPPRSATLPVEKPIARQFRETQSEIADYGFGRRSCDTGPRFSLDAGRVSFDDPRYSFDEPRASWDGYFVGRRLPPMVEDENVVPVVRRTDATIPVVEDERFDGSFVIEEEEEDENVPGGSVQTREYYLDSSSSSRRRKSLDRSSSIRMTAAAVVAEIDELKGVSNAKVSPEMVECVNGGGGGKVLRHSSSLRDDCSKGFELGFRENGEEVKGGKKSRRWNWNIWGLMHLRGGGGNKEEYEERYGGSRGNGVERSLSESWQEIRREGNGEGGKGAFGGRSLLRSTSSVSWRNSSNVVGGSFVSARKSSVEMNGHGKKKKKKNKEEEVVLERNRSAKCSANDIENGLLRFYLTPLRGSRRGGFGKSKSNNSHSIARSVLRLY